MVALKRARPIPFRGISYRIEFNLFSNLRTAEGGSISTRLKPVKRLGNSYN